MEDAKPQAAKNRKWLGPVALVLAGVGLGVLVGNWLDRKFGWEPWGLLACTLLGLAGGMYLLIKDAIRMNKD